jgi:copper chaperone CopZ
MKRYIFVLLSIFLVACASNKISAQTKSDTLTVRGTCGMCKERIEEAVYKIKGVKEAKWNSKTEILKVVYNSKKTTLQIIAEAAAQIGHDSRLSAATKEQYSTLPDCCAYRTGAKCAHD